MPEAYTHIRIARATKKAAALDIYSQSAYEMGANGPDPFFCGGVFPNKSKVNMQKLGSKIHSEKCGKFLCALVIYAKTPIQRSYALGFITHYAADTVMHPYVAAMSENGAQFEGAGGHGFCEVAMDTHFYKLDTGKNGVPVDAAAPLLTAQELAQISALLKQSLRAVFEIDVPSADLADMFHMFRLVHKLTLSRVGFRKIFAHGLDNILRTNKYLASHITPHKTPKEGFTKSWKNPYSGETLEAGPHVLCMKAVSRGAVFTKAACNYWNANETPVGLYNTFGDMSYSTGKTLAEEKQADTNSA